MVVIPFMVVWVGYTMTIYGWTLLKGWDISLVQLANPVKPYQWPVPPQEPPQAGPDRVWPRGTTTPASGGSAPVLEA